MALNRIIAVRCAKWVVFSFQHFSGGILDMRKGCVVTADLCTGKRWIGVETACSGQAKWVSFDKSPPNMLEVRSNKIHISIDLAAQGSGSFLHILQSPYSIVSPFLTVCKCYCNLFEIH